MARGFRHLAWGLSCLLGLCALGAGPLAAASPIRDAAFVLPTTRYDHAILGDNIEWGGLQITQANGRTTQITLPDTAVFEDLTPRLIDLTGDGAPEVLVIETSLTQGARLAAYDAEGLIAATPFIGRTHRWLAPIGAADLDGDGQIEIAYIDRPHLAKTLRIWRLNGDQMTEVAQLSGLTNHKIGQDFISGGIRTCDAGPEIITLDSDWQNIMATTLTAKTITARKLAPFTGQASLQQALACKR